MQMKMIFSRQTSFKDPIQISKICVSLYFPGAKKRIVQLTGFENNSPALPTQSPREEGTGAARTGHQEAQSDSLEKAKRREVGKGRKKNKTKKQQKLKEKAKPVFSEKNPCGPMQREWMQQGYSAMSGDEWMSQVTALWNTTRNSARDSIDFFFFSSPYPPAQKRYMCLDQLMPLLSREREGSDSSTFHAVCRIPVHTLGRLLG